MVTADLHGALVDALDDAVIVSDLDGAVTVWNRAAEALYGWTAAETIGCNIRDLTVLPAEAGARDAIMDALGRGDAWEGDLLLRQKDGSPLLAHVRDTPLPSAGGEAIGILGISRDVTEARIREYAAAAVLDAPDAAASAIPALIAVAGLADPDSPRWLYFSEQWSAYTGWSRERLLAGSLRPLRHPDDLPPDRAATLRTRMLAGEPFGGLLRLRAASGDYRWFQFHHRPVRDAAGTPVFGVLAGFDVHDAHESREQAQSQAAFARQLADGIPALVIGSAANDDGLVMPIFYNLQWNAFSGLTEEQLLGPERERLYLPEDWARMDTLRAESASLDGMEGEIRFRRADGEYRWHRFIHRPIRDDLGRVTLYIAVAVDIHDRVTAEEANARLAAIVESSEDAILSKTLDGTITTWNRGAEHLYGYSAAEVLGQHVDLLVPDERRHELPGIFDRLRRGERVNAFETLRRTKDGGIITVMLTVSPVRDGSGRIVGASALARDIGPEKEAERAMREYAGALASINRVNRELSGNLDLDELVQKVTDASTSLTGAQFGAFFYNAVDRNGEHYTRYSISGAPREAFESFPLPRNSEIFDPTFRGEGVVRLDDVTKHPRYGRNAPYHGMPEGHLPVRSYLAVPVVARDGSVIGGLFFGHERPGVFTLRSEQIAVGIAAQTAIAIENARLYSEREEHIEELRRANAIKDEFLALVSHELRTPLTAIVGMSRQLQKRLGPLDEETAGVLGDLGAYGQRLQSTVENMLMLTRLGHETVDLEPLLVQHTVARAVDECRARYPGTPVELEVAPNLPPVEGHPGWFAQVIENLLSNAVKYGASGGPVSVRVYAAGEDVAVSVADRGPGIPEEEAAQIFEPFYRTSRAAAMPGAGLGLTVCLRLMDLQGGSITYAPRAGGGASFEVRLPVIA